MRRFFKHPLLNSLILFYNNICLFIVGNELLHVITNQGWYELRVDMSDFDGNSKYAKYKVFRIGDGASGYQLVVSGYSGDAGEFLIFFIYFIRDLNIGNYK